MGETVLEVQKLSISFGGLKAVSDFNLSLEQNALYGLIGPNGAGKTTVFNLITGVYEPDEGALRLSGTDLLGLAPHERTQRGVARTFQNIRLFKDLSVLDNVLVSYHMQRPYGYWDTLLRTPRFYRVEKELKEQALQLLAIFKLQDRAEDLAANLSYGDQRRLEMARALAAKPKVLLLDEPCAGLNSQEKVGLMNVIAHIRNRFELSVLVIEHDMKFVMGICEQILVLDHGELIAEGPPQQIQKDNRVIEAYLGVANA